MTTEELVQIAINTVKAMTPDEKAKLRMRLRRELGTGGRCGNAASIRVLRSCEVRRSLS